MEMEKAYVSRDGKVTIQCNHCGMAKTFNMASLKTTEKPYRVRCTCKNVFGVFFESRRAYRKETNLKGTYIGHGLKNLAAMRVRSLSMTGIGFTTLSMHNLNKGNRLQLKFTLDDMNRSEIEKEAIVKWINKKEVGCDFVGSEQYDKALGFYLMP
jgi:hypothetical protein